MLPLRCHSGPQDGDGTTAVTWVDATVDIEGLAK